jgi:release factor glutamine methyltransferase
MRYHESVKINEWLSITRGKLAEHSTTPLLDAEVLLCDELNVNKAWLLAHNDAVLQGVSLQRMDIRVLRRVSGEPLAYIRGFAEFYGRRFVVNSDVLVPRPESESIIELFIKEYRGEAVAKVADVGSGSGALGITAVLELPQISVDFYDIDKNTLRVAQINAQKHNVDSQFFTSDLLEPNCGP